MERWEDYCGGPVSTGNRSETNPRVRWEVCAELAGPADCGAERTHRVRQTNPMVRWASAKRTPALRQTNPMSLRVGSGGWSGSNGKKRRTNPIAPRETNPMDI